MDSDPKCGIACFKPQALRRCANMGVFVGFYCPAALCTSAISVYMASQITTLEKQFGFTSSQTGFLMSCNDIGFLLTTLFVAHLARKIHIPRALLFSTILYGFAGVFCSLAYFLSPEFGSKPEMNVNTSSPAKPFSTFWSRMCLESNVNISESCDVTSQKIGAPTEYTKVALSIIVIGMMVQGFGKAPRQPYITTYVDDNVPKHKTACYMGVVTSLSIFGPAVGFGLGAVFSQTYVTLEDVSLTVRDPRWIGAWWLGFLVIGGVAVFASLPLMCFPKRMKYNRIKKTRTPSRRNRAKENMKELLKSVLRILRNARFMINIFAVCLTLLTVGGFFAFVPKYVETQFTIPAWYANLIIGGVGVISMSLGTITGAIFTTYRKLTPLGCLKVIIVITAISIIAPVLGLYLGCPNPEIIGLNVKPSTNNTCTDQCNCDNSDSFPVCGSDGRNYLTPCHAGCQRGAMGLQGFNFQNCTCIENMGTAKPGLCKADCAMLWPFMITVFVFGVVSAVSIIPSIIFIIRCVSDEDKAVAIGLSSFLQTLLGWMPGPVIAGKIIDTCCKLWNSSCYGSGSCSLYDIEAFRFRTNILSICSKAVVLLLYIVLFFISRKSTDWSTGNVDEETEDISENEELVFDMTKPEFLNLRKSNV